MSSYITNLLQGLGKPTKRGIKKCSKCGVYNGTRGNFCKNQQCGTSLKHATNYLIDFDAVQLETGTVRQVFSVHVAKDSISECRGFVQLPHVQYCTEDQSNLLSNVALCFVDSCQSSFDNSILKCHEEEPSYIQSEVCSHINLALRSQVTAKPLIIEKNILTSLKIPEECKEKLWLLACDTKRPLVQRVATNVIAVKCQVTPKQPLGYLHFTFLKGKNKGFEKYHCNCTEYLMAGCHDKSMGIKYKCIHYYACIAALASNQDYFNEFHNFLANEITSRNKATCSNTIKGTKQIEPFAVKGKYINIISNQLIKKQTVSKDISKSALKSQKYIIKRCKKIVPKIYPIEIKVLNEITPNKDENNVSWQFFDWLAFVTESINKTMQFINCGIINTQVFYIPEDFFDSFKKRIPEGYEEQTTDIGSIYYSIMNVNHVKEVFDTPKVKLRIAKKFIHDQEKGYIEYDDETNESTSLYQSSFIFFLNNGCLICLPHPVLVN
ncbi:uncharacterized protein C2orf42 isoform X2 [Anthonomus grandis grandis]|uniref:uncharacterized protein C2orf42 isoform X2 n=1 Tax=Anthonomus grandis grandis TaxID=2921223 RepID=UPI002164F0A9|nr:uncharacterized protein C2orf42 isoform X2 [Anthonomus grandis grandis]